MTNSTFSKNVLVSIRPLYASKILDGRKTVELRRKFPESTSTGAIILIYSSSPVQAIVGHARIDAVKRLPVPDIWEIYGNAACITKNDFDSYFDGLDHGYAILLTDVHEFQTKLKAAHLREKYGFTPPQSFRYVGDEYHSLLNDEHLQAPRRHQRRHPA